MAQSSQRKEPPQNPGRFNMFEAAGYEIIRLEPKVQFEFVDGTSARAAIPIFEVIAKKVRSPSAMKP
jgi:hypothetical protein